jgi:YfiH family protein
VSESARKLEWVEADWPAPGGVRALCTLRNGGVSAAPYASLNLGDHVGDTATAVAENRRRLKAEAGFPSEPMWLRQVHGVNVVDLDGAPDDGAATGGGGAAADVGAAAGDVGGAANVGTVAPADAAFSRRRGRVCAILTADCLPLLLTADTGAVVAAAHVGWRGLSLGVIEATVQALKVPPQSLMAWLGPAIGPEHFEVGAEVREALLKGDPGAQCAFAPNARGRFLADLGRLATRRLATLGVGRIFGGGECTFAAADRYFSHRRDGVTGRQATLIWLEPA